jgi:hypothetical protein
MQQQEQQQPGGWTPIQDAQKAANWFVLAARVLASPLEVILRKNFGSKYFGIPSAVALFTVPMWALFWPDASPVGLWVLWVLFIVMQLRARLESVRMIAKGEVVHTRFNGSPRLASVFKRMPEQKIKAGLEPLLVFIVGVLLMQVSPPLGSYLMVAAFSLGFNHSVIEAVERAQALEMNDALIEQQSVAERFRNMQRDR